MYEKQQPAEMNRFIMADVFVDHRCIRIELHASDEVGFRLLKLIHFMYFFKRFPKTLPSKQGLAL